MNKDTGMSSKLNALLRLGLVSKNNVRRALYVMQNPEQAMKSASYRTLIQELLIDVVDRILNNKSLYNLVRQNLVKDSSSPVTENVSDERTKTLLRSGLVKKKDVVLARRALSSKKNFKQMSQVGVYRELMIDMLDSMAKKITGNPVLFNAFKRTMGDQQADESFEMPNAESIMEFELNKDFTELLETHKPNNTKLWVESKKKAKGKFDTCSCEKCEEAWAMKWYNEHDGEWTPITEGKSFFGFMNQVDEVLTPKQKKIDINKNKRLDAQDFKALRTAKVAEETEQVDELSKGLLKRYKAAATVNADNLEKEGDYYARHLQGKMKDAEMGKRDPVTPKEKKLSMKIRDRMHKKSDARREKIGQAERKLGEDVEQVDELSKKTKDAYVAKRGSQLSSMMYGSGKNYNSLTGKKQANAVKGIKKAMGVKEETTPSRGATRKQLDAEKIRDYRAAQKFYEKDMPNQILRARLEDRKRTAAAKNSVKEDVEQVDEAGQAKLYRMRYSHGRAWRRGDKKKQDAMGIATYDKQTKEDAKDLKRTGSAFGMRVKRLAGNRKAMGYSESAKKLGHNFVEMAQSHNRRREMEKHLSNPLNNWMKKLDDNEKNDNEHLYGLGGKKVKFHTRKKRALATGMKEWIEGESQKGVSDKAKSIAKEIHIRIQKQEEQRKKSQAQNKSQRK